MANTNVVDQLRKIAEGIKNALEDDENQEQDKVEIPNQSAKTEGKSGY